MLYTCAVFHTFHSTAAVPILQSRKGGIVYTVPLLGIAVSHLPARQHRTWQYLTDGPAPSAHFAVGTVSIVRLV